MDTFQGPAHQKILLYLQFSRFQALLVLANRGYERAWVFPIAMVKWYSPPLDTQKMTPVLVRVSWLWTEKHREALTSLPNEGTGLRPSCTSKTPMSMKLDETMQADAQHCTHICLKFKSLVQTTDRYSNKTFKEIVFIEKGNENVCLCLWAPHFLWGGHKAF